MIPKRPPSNSDIQVIREWRKAYMRSYRSGNSEHKKMIKKSSNKVLFRQLGYYLDEAVLQAVGDFCKEHKLNRNTVVTMSLDKFFGHRRYKYEIRISDTPIFEKRFLHDRIDVRIYERLNEFTKVFGKYERQVKMTSVVEQAIRELVMPNVQYAYGIKFKSRVERKSK